MRQFIGAGILSCITLQTVSIANQSVVPSGHSLLCFDCYLTMPHTHTHTHTRTHTHTHNIKMLISLKANSTSRSLSPNKELCVCMCLLQHSPITSANPQHHAHTSLSSSSSSRTIDGKSTSARRTFWTDALLMMNGLFYACDMSLRLTYFNQRP